VAYEEQRAGSYPTDRWEYGESLRFCYENAGLEACSCLEIGAGDGAFVSRLIGSGVPVASITALEYSDFGADAISSRYPGVSVRHGDDLAALPDGRFDRIFLFQVLEHIGNLDAFLFQLRRLLRPQGWVFASVPNPRGIEFNELNGLLLDMPPNHVSRFTDAAARRLALRNGFLLKKLTDQDFSWREMLPQYLKYRYLRLGQKAGSLPAMIDANLSGTPRKIAAAVFAATLIPRALADLRVRGKIGNSRLIVLQKLEA
jgi:SAM-dependent methyltransferase